MENCQVQSLSLTNAAIYFKSEEYNKFKKHTFFFFQFKTIKLNCDDDCQLIVHENYNHACKTVT